MQKKSIFEVLEFNNYYKCYTAESCRKTGLPMFGGNISKEEYYDKYKDKFLSKTRCKEIKKPVYEGEEPVAFYRMLNGYIPLYLRG
ncbi:hypothetical protein EQY97_10220 [Clostridium perfringens]|nr:hypothetical protein [Clostridium perfringens]